MRLYHFGRAVLISLLFAVAGGACAAPLKPGDMAPDIVGRTLDAEAVTVSAHRGKVVVLSFWATWCPYCLKELPILEGIQKVAGHEKVQVIAVNTESSEVFRKVERQLKSLTLKQAYDPGKKGRDAYGVQGIPHLVIIGRDGRIIKVYRGYDDASLDAIVADINGAIAEAPAS
jgi:thiol-disulfide isomerase/thioredoxin